jgi:hypothetical protein
MNKYSKIAEKTGDAILFAGKVWSFLKTTPILLPINY